MKIHIKRETKSMYKNLLIFFILFQSILFSQSNNPASVIAVVGNTAITQKEFLLRYESNPFLFPENAHSNLQKKYAFLYALIAEKLWAQYAIDKNYGENNGIQTAIKGMKSMFLRDALYQKCILDSITVDSADIASAKSFLRNTIIVNYLYSNDQDEIMQLKNLLDQGFPFDSLLAARDEYLHQEGGLPVKFGDLVPHIEKAVFNLKTDDYSNILLAPDGYYIFYKRNFSYEVFENGQYTERDEKIKQVIRSKKANEKYMEFMESFFTGQRIEADPQNFEFLVTAIHYILSDRNEKNELMEDSSYFFYHSDIFELYDVLGDSVLSDTLVYFQIDPVTVKSFLNEYAFGGIRVFWGSKEYIATQVNTDLREFIKNKLLIHFADSLGLADTPSFKDELAMWKDYYYSDAIQNEKLKTSSGSSLANKNVLEMNEKLSKQTFELTKQYPVEINHDKLKSMNLTQVTTFVFKRLGFGGQIEAAPLVAPLTMWINYLPKKSELLP